MDKSDIILEKLNSIEKALRTEIHSVEKTLRTEIQAVEKNLGDRIDKLTENQDMFWQALLETRNDIQKP
jgi:S-adenosylhomocysteine hydrolase